MSIVPIHEMKKIPELITGTDLTQRQEQDFVLLCQNYLITHLNEFAQGARAIKAIVVRLSKEKKWVIDDCKIEKIVSNLQIFSSSKRLPKPQDFPFKIKARM